MKTLTIEKMCEIVGCREYSYLGDEMFPLLFDKEKREKIFLEFLDNNWDVSKDWFTGYFEDHIADRKNLKQDYTPHAVTEVLNQLIGSTDRTLEVAAGTGGILISKWNHDRVAVKPLDYHPSNYFYWAEEYSKKNIPFLLFNLLIRGMNAVAIHCDSLTRVAEQVYFICNDMDDPLKFSNLNVMPRSKICEEYFNIKKWINEPIIHTESPKWIDKGCEDCGNT